MIVSCNNCVKSFNIDSNLIPKKGRLLQCSNCNHKWFFKKEIVNDSITPTKPKIFIEELKPIISENSENMDLLDKKINHDYEIDVNSSEKETKIDEVQNLEKVFGKHKKNYKILNKIIIFIISFIALIIILDTFKGPIAKIVPNIEFFLYNLYESINDIVLFFKDLI